MTLRLTIREVYRTAKNQYQGIFDFGWLSIILLSLFFVSGNYLNLQTVHDKNPGTIIYTTLAIIYFLSAITLWGLYYRTREYLHGHTISAIKQPWIGFVKFLKGILASILISICFAIASIPLLILCAILRWAGVQFGMLFPAMFICGLISLFYVFYLLMYINVYFLSVLFEDRNIFACLKISTKMLFGNWWHWILTTFVCAIIFSFISGILFITTLTANPVIQGIVIAIDFILLAFYFPFFISIIITEYNNLKSYRNC